MPFCKKAHMRTRASVLPHTETSAGIWHEREAEARAACGARPFIVRFSENVSENRLLLPVHVGVHVRVRLLLRGRRVVVFFFLSSAAISCISPSVREKSNTSKLLLTCAGFDEPGMTIKPFCICQRRMICTALLPYFLPSFSKTFSCKSALSPWPSGYQLISFVP